MIAKQLKISTLNMKTIREKMIFKKELSKKIEVPIVDFLLSNKNNLNANFHALPIFHLKEGDSYYKKYKELYGQSYLSLETTVTGKLFDSFFYPIRCIKKAQDYVSELFGSNDTLFVTCGTSISNHIVVDALVNENSRVLLDRESHQSMHFAVKNKKTIWDYFYSAPYCKTTERKYLDLKMIIEKILQAKNENRPYDVMILSASSYDGVICNVYEIIKNVANICPEIKFIVDEAWSSALYFHPILRQYTAGYAAEKLKGKVNIVSTQSAHKSLMALRQASFIHSFSNDSITEALYRSRFKNHSTSPNYAILASMDLARGQMQEYGDKMMKKTLFLAEKLQAEIQSNERLKIFRHEKLIESLENISNGVSIADPLKVHLNTKSLNMTPIELQEYLYHHYHVYFNRYTENSVLINIHIGITEKHIDCLISALENIAKIQQCKNLSEINDNEFLISYPPGIPMHSPGEIMKSSINDDVQRKLKSGINVFQV